MKGPEKMMARTLRNAAKDFFFFQLRVFEMSFCSAGMLQIFFFFLAALGLRCCARAFSSCGERGLLLLVAVRGLLTVVAFCCRARALGTRASVVVARGV